MNEEEIFHEALARGGPRDREAYLEQACAGRPALRASVEALLRANVGASGYMDRPALGVVATMDEPKVRECAGTVIGPYKLLEQIGEGGMGVVFMAEQVRPVQRRVALKIIKAGMDTREVIARFEAERQALAMMDHPNIARVLDAGATDTGRPYFVMELVRGVPMTEFCNQKNLSIRERLELFVTVCQAVQHAHQKGIIHRDIKPTNVLVTLHDGRPMIKVIDFGVAKATGQKLTDKTLFTGFTQMIGTPLYMSPEQAEMTSQDIDTRSDIFSAGVLLYELLTGTTPFDSQRLKSASFDELRRIIREEEPPRPSTRLTTIAAEAASTVGTQRKSDPRQLSRLFRGELDWIVMKCLEKARTRRYETASALAGDVERYLHDEPVQACPPSARYRFGKFARRNKGALGTAAVVITVLLLATVVSAAFILGAFDRESTQRATAEQQRDLATHNLYLAHMRQLPNDWASGGIVRFHDTLERWLPQPGKSDFRGWEWYYFESLLHRDLMTLRGHEGAVLSVKWSPDGRMLASGGKDGTIRLWNSATGKQEREFQLKGGTVFCVAWSSDGCRLAAASADRFAHILDASSGTQIRTIRMPEAENGYQLAYSPDGERLAVLSNENCVVIYDAATGDSLRVIPKDQELSFFSIAWSPDSRRIAVGGGSYFKIIDAATGAPQSTIRVPECEVFGLAWSPDGSLVASGTYGNYVSMSDPTTGEHRHAIKTNAAVDTVAFHPDGKLLAGGSRNQRIELWSVNTLNHVGCLRGHLDSITEVGWSPDGTRLASASLDGTIKIWDPLQLPDAVTISQNQATGGLAWSPNDDRLACGWFDGTIKLVDPNTRNVVATSSGPPIDGQCLLGHRAWSPDGRFLVSHTSDCTIVWDLSNGFKEFLRIPVESANFAFHPDSERLAVAVKGERQVQLWDVPRKTKLASFDATLGAVENVAWSPNGAHLATVGFDGLTKIWNASDQKLLRTLRVHSPNKWLGPLEWSPDGKWIAASGFDREIFIWNTETWEQLSILRGHCSAVVDIAWSPDGERIASASSDETVRLWDGANGDEIMVLPLGGTGFGRADVAWSHDGTRLATAAVDGHCCIWDARIGYQRAKELQPLPAIR